jgi:hypothetical protein
MICEWEQDCICLKCASNRHPCGCAECEKMGSEPYFYGDCILFIEIEENEKSVKTL